MYDETISLSQSTPPVATPDLPPIPALTIDLGAVTPPARDLEQPICPACKGTKQKVTPGPLGAEIHSHIQACPVCSPEE